MKKVYILFGRMLLLPFFLTLTPTLSFSSTTYEGVPLYTARKTQSSPLSFHGSHYGVKADVEGESFFNLIMFSALTRIQNTEMDRFFVTLRTPEGELLAKPENRHVAFSYLGWKETASEKGIVAVGSVFFVDTDVLLMTVTVKNASGKPAIFSPVLHFDALSENYPTENLGNTYKPVPALAEEVDSHTSLLTRAYGSFTGSFAIQRVLFSSLERVDIEKKDEKSSALLLKETTVLPGNTLSFHVYVAFMLSTEAKDAVMARLVNARQKLEPMPDVYDAEVTGWKKLFLSKLPPLPQDTKKFQELYELAATGLMMNLYAPRNKMEKTCSVPAKVHFNSFWGWDTPFQSMGQSEFDSQLAWDNIRIQFETQAKNGMVYQILADDTKKVMWNFSQPPVQGWALKKLFEQDTDRKRAAVNLEWVYPKLAAYIEWFQKSRDADGDGLLEALNPYEEGWDDTPRLAFDRKGFAGGTANTQHIDNLVMTSWALLSLRILNEFAQILDKRDDAGALNKKIETLAEKMDSGFWSEACQCWLDYNTQEKKHVNVLTPANWFPAFARGTKNLKRVKAVIEKHLLNPKEFFGAYPVPTVAYNDPNYNHEDDGTYWRGQIWLNTSFVTLQTLFQYGYENEANEILRRTLKMIDKKGGLYENYNALTGGVGLSSKGKGSPSAYQLGWSCAFAMQMLQRRYERERFLLERAEPAKNISGFVHKIKTFPDEETFLEVVAEPYSYEMPFLVLKSLDGKPLETSKKISVQLLSKGKNFSGKKLSIHFKTRTATFILPAKGKKKMYFPREEGGTSVPVPVNENEKLHVTVIAF